MSRIGKRNQPMRFRRLRNDCNVTVGKDQMIMDMFEQDVQKMESSIKGIQLGFNFRMSKDMQNVVQNWLNEIEGPIGDNLHITMTKELTVMGELRTFNPNTIFMIRYHVQDTTTQRFIARHDINASQKVVFDGKLMAILRGGREYYRVDEALWNKLCAFDSFEAIYATLETGTIQTDGTFFVNMETLLTVANIFNPTDLMIFSKQ